MLAWHPPWSAQAPSAISSMVLSVSETRLSILIILS